MIVIDNNIVVCVGDQFFARADVGKIGNLEKIIQLNFEHFRTFEILPTRTPAENWSLMQTAAQTTRQLICVWQ